MMKTALRGSYMRYSWKGDRMYLGTKRTLYGLLKHEEYGNMFYVYTPSGVSIDFYNITWAKQHCRYLYMRDYGLVEQD